MARSDAARDWRSRSGVSSPSASRAPQRSEKRLERRRGFGERSPRAVARAPARDVYVRHFGFALTHDSDASVSLRRRHGQPFELAIVQADHPSMPAAYRKPAAGLLLSFEVEDVDASCGRLVRQERLPLVSDMRSENFGHWVILADPSAVVVDIIKPIPRSSQLAALYAADALPASSS